MKSLNLLIWITQFGFSVISPILLYLGLAVWLRNRFGLGVWILVILGIIGISAAVRSAAICLRHMCRAADKASDTKAPPIAFNNHN